MELIDYEDFAKVKLALGKIIEVNDVDKSEKLLELKVKFGEEERIILAGIKKFYTREELLNKTALFVYNLKPRKMMGKESQGMILAVSDEGNNESEKSLSILVPDRPMKDGLLAR